MGAHAPRSIGAAPRPPRSPSGVPPEAFGPFDRPTALDNDIINLCEFWPAAPTPPAFGAGPATGRPRPAARGRGRPAHPGRVGAAGWPAQFPQARLYVAPATGHSALGSDFSGCIERAFTRFFLGRRLPGPCRGVRRRPRPTPPVPASLAEVRRIPGVPGRRGRSLRAVVLTLNDVFDDYSFGFLSGFSSGLVSAWGGLRGGRWVVRADGALALQGIRFVPGVRVSGRAARARSSRGSGAACGSAAQPRPDGRLVLRGRRIRGRLGGRRIRARLSRRGRLGGGAARPSAFRRLR